MKGRRAIFICNALEDSTRIEREIYSDSPAASKKTFQMASALQSVGERVVVLSMGRGQPNGAARYFKGKAHRLDGVLVIYAPFCQVQLVSQCLSFLSLPLILYRMNRFRGKTTAIFYNRTSAYISSLLTCTLLGHSRVLDLEDGEIPQTGWSMQKLFLKSKRWLYNRLCSDGTILACSALAMPEAKRPGLCYYGAVRQFRIAKSWQGKSRYKFLMGGTVSYETGAQLLVDAINSLRERPELWVDKLEFIITGKGDCLEQFKALSVIEKPPLVSVMGRLTDRDYSSILQACNVGLALKPNFGTLADTTFPSKVVELASAGLLVLTTNISDVKYVLGAGALYLNDDRLDSLLASLKWVAENPQLAESLAQVGVSTVEAQCAFNTAGIKLSNYIFNDET